MPKRIYLLAKELDKSNKEILEALADLGIDKNSPSQNLTDQEEAQVVSYIELMAHAVISAPPPERPKEEKIDKPEPKAAHKAPTPEVKAPQPEPPKAEAPKSAAPVPPPQEKVEVKPSPRVEVKPPVQPPHPVAPKPPVPPKVEPKPVETKTPASPAAKPVAPAPAKESRPAEHHRQEERHPSRDQKRPPAAQQKAHTAPKAEPKAPPAPKEEADVDRKRRDKKFFEKGKSEGTITISEGMTIKDLSEKMGVKAKDILQKLLAKGVLYTVNKSLSLEEAQMILDLFGMECKSISFEDKVLEDVREEETQGGEESLCERPPVVTVMGHVDHGKTTLLDTIRHTHVAAKEHGGITQHIGASKILFKNKPIVFIDTPGHEAFTKLRLRGANVTDLVILVVAADDGVKPQTIEAINHAKSAGVPIIVAINKIDKPDVNLLKVKQELVQYGIVVEEYGGDAVCVPVSAKKGIGIEDLLDMILLVAEVHEFKGNPRIPAKGTILEAQLDPQRGPIASVLIQEGILSLGDAFISGSTAGRVRALFDDKGKRLKEAKMVTPVEVSGFEEVPSAGDSFQVVNTIEKAQQISLLRKQMAVDEKRNKTAGRLSLNDLFDRIKEKEVQKLPLILKTDVQGSMEAIEDSLAKIQHPDVTLQIIHKAAGPITESDILLASTTNAIIIAYNVRPSKRTREQAKEEQVEIRYYSIIYQLIEDIKQSLEGILKPIEKEHFLGTVDVRKVFKVPRVGSVAGCYVSEGKVEKDDQVRIVRNGIVVHTGKIQTLHHYTQEVESVKEGQECGIRLENYSDIKAGDSLEVFKIEQIKQKI